MRQITQTHLGTDEAQQVCHNNSYVRVFAHRMAEALRIFAREIH